MIGDTSNGLLGVAGGSGVNCGGVTIAGASLQGLQNSMDSGRQMVSQDVNREGLVALEQRICSTG